MDKIPTTTYTLSNGSTIQLRDYISQSSQERILTLLHGDTKIKVSAKKDDKEPEPDTQMEFTISDSFAYTRALIEAHLAGEFTYDDYDCSPPDIREEIKTLVESIHNKKK